MTEPVRETTTVAIVGAGPAGLTLATLLRASGIAFVAVERQSRSYVEQRQRAGVLDYRAGRIFEESGLADAVLGNAPLDSVLEIRYEGIPRYLNVPDLAGGRHSRIVPQQILVRRLVAMLVDGGADVRFDAQD